MSVSGDPAGPTCRAHVRPWAVSPALCLGRQRRGQIPWTFDDIVESALSRLTAASLLVFSLLYTPCVAAIAAIRRELGRGWALGVVLWQCGLAWLAAALVRGIGLLLGLG